MGHIWHKAKFGFSPGCVCVLDWVTSHCWRSIVTWNSPREIYLPNIGVLASHNPWHIPKRGHLRKAVKKKFIATSDGESLRGKDIQRTMPFKLKDYETVMEVCLNACLFLTLCVWRHPACMCVCVCIYISPLVTAKTRDRQGDGDICVCIPNITLWHRIRLAFSSSLARGLGLSCFLQYFWFNKGTDWININIKKH